MQTSFCYLCGQPLTHRSKLIHHPHWPEDRQLRVCIGCYRNKPRCRACNIPMASSLANGLCPTCVEHIPLCLICNQPIIGQGWKINGGAYCETCRRERPPCDVCGVPMGNRHWKLSDGRIFCQSCYTSAVFTPQEAAALYAKVKTVIAHTTGLSLNIPTSLILVDRDQLAEIIRKQSNGNKTLEIEKTLGIYTRRGIQRAIYAQIGLPRPVFLRVAAHEYAHAWQGENCPLLESSLMREGFAEWVAHRVMEHYSYDAQMKEMQARDDIYGQGLSWALNLEAKAGTTGVLEACRKAM